MGTMIRYAGFSVIRMSSAHQDGGSNSSWRPKNRIAPRRSQNSTCSPPSLDSGACKLEVQCARPPILDFGACKMEVQCAGADVPIALECHFPARLSCPVQVSCPHGNLFARPFRDLQK